MPVVNVHEAKTHLSRLLTQVEAGEEVTIARNGTAGCAARPLSTARQAEVRRHAGTHHA